MDPGGLMSVGAAVVVADSCHERHSLGLYPAGSMVPFLVLLYVGSMVVTMIDAVLARKFPVPLLVCGPSMKVLYYTLHTWLAFNNLIGASCGMAGITHGALAVGMVTMVATDCMACLLELLKIWQGGTDPHAQTLLRVLSTAHLFHSRVLVLEFVGPAWSDSFVLQCPEQFASLVGYQTEVVTLDFQVVCLCGRHRSWWIVCEPGLGSLGLAEWRTLRGPLEIQRLSPLDNGLCFPVASSFDALSSQAIRAVHPSEVLVLNRNGRQVSPTHSCGVGGSKAVDVGTIPLLMVMYTILGFCVALMQSRVQVAVQFRLLTRLQFLSVCRIGGAIRPGPEGGFSHVVMGIAFPMGSRCKATCVDLCASCLVMPWCAQWLDEAGNWVIKFSRTSFRRLSKELDSLPVPAPLQTQWCVAYSSQSADFDTQVSVLRKEVQRSVGLEHVSFFIIYGM